MKLVLGILAFSAVAAQDVPLPPVPLDLAPATRAAFDSEHRALVARIDAQNAQIDAFMARCSAVVEGSAAHAACARDYAALGAVSRQLDTDKTNFASRLAAAPRPPCSDFRAQLDRDLDAMRRQQATNAMGFRELDEWTKQSQDAQKAAITLGAKTLLGNVADKLEAKERSAAAFQGWLTRYEKQVRDKGVPIESLRGKIETAMRGYVAAKIQAKGGVAVNAGLDVAGAWEQLTTFAGAIATTQAKSNAAVKAALDDPAFKAFVNTDATARDAARTFLDMAIESDELKKFAPGYGVLTFAIDYGYEATKWTTAYNRIVQQNNLAGEQLKAVDALKRQIERTTQSLKACQAR